MPRTLYWSTNDLRIDDNPTLLCAAESEQLLCVATIDPAWFSSDRYAVSALGPRRLRFLREGLADLEQQLAALGQSLLMRFGNPLDEITALIQQHGIERLVVSRQFGWYEQQTLALLRRHHPTLEIVEVDTYTLFDLSSRPFDCDNLPPSFTPFRKQAERCQIIAPLPAPSSLPPPLITGGDNQLTWQHIDSHVSFTDLAKHSQSNTTASSDDQSRFSGGAQAARRHVQAYFSDRHLSTYKETRNALDTWSHSSKMSPWLAQGSLSVRRLYAEIKHYEDSVEANESTYWLFFELLWREYFQWLAMKSGRTLFRYAGKRKHKEPMEFNRERFDQWRRGETAYPIVNACMKQLASTGYMSNRGRQLAASCLIHEMALDWRLGAAWFEHCLLDYDVASNWGNWQYIAGVGADPRGGRQFNLHKQSQQYDPDGAFVRRWSEAPSHSLKTNA